MTRRKIQFIFYLVSLLIVTIVFIWIIKKTNGIAAENSHIEQFFNNAWATDNLWDDGKAEVAIYDAERIIYGKNRHYDHVYILVKETFNKEYNVKTDDYSRNDLFDVMKVNKFARIETDRYPYNYLSSLFFKRNSPAQLYKFTNSSQEWCGNTFKNIDRHHTGYIYDFNSYWDSQGIGTNTLPLNILFEDQLSYTLRTLNFEDQMSFNCQILESQITNKANNPEIYKATVSVREINDLPVELEDFIQGGLWEVSVNLSSDKKNFYWFSGIYPNELLKMETWDGRRMLLKSITRDAYWLD